MKKYILAAALVLASTSAMADRVVSGSSGTYYTYHVDFKDKGEACETAKKSAAGKSRGAQVEGYTKCDCDQDSKGFWSCSVDARLENER